MDSEDSPNPVTIRVETRQPQLTAVFRASGNPEAVEATMDRAEAAVKSALDDQGIDPAGPPFWRYFEMSDERYSYEAGFPVAAPIRETDEVLNSELPGGEVIVATQKGHPDNTADTHDLVDEWIRRQGCDSAGPPWEVYKTIPYVETDGWEGAVTEIYYPLA